MNFKLAAVSAEKPEDLAAGKEKTKAEFAFLSDAEGKLADAFGLRHEGGNPMDGSDITRPAVVALKKDGTVVFVDPTENYRVRPAPAEIAERLRTADPAKG